MSASATPAWAWTLSSAASMMRKCEVSVQLPRTESRLRACQCAGDAVQPRHDRGDVAAGARTVGDRAGSGPSTTRGAVDNAAAGDRRTGRRMPPYNSASVSWKLDSARTRRIPPGPRPRIPLMRRSARQRSRPAESGAANRDTTGRSAGCCRSSRWTRSRSWYRSTAGTVSSRSPKPPHAAAAGRGSTRRWNYCR